MKRITAASVLLIGSAFIACEVATDPEPEPGPVSVAPSWPDVAAGVRSTCALTAEGQTYCWGYDHFHWNAVPPPSDTSYDHYPFADDLSVPQPVQNAPTFARLGAGVVFFCGVTEDGQVYCWGHNEMGQLGDDTGGGDRWRAGPVATELRFAGIEAVGEAHHVCARTGTGEAYCWGANNTDQLGAGSDAGHPHPAPVAVAGGHTFRLLSVANSRSCGLTTESELYCWGVVNGSAHPEPVVIVASVILDTLAANSDLMLGLVEGEAYVRWNGDSTSQPEFTPVSTDLRFRRITIGRGHACGLTTNGAAYCWGANPEGQLGDGTLDRREVPTPVAGDYRFAKISAGGMHTCAITTDGEFYCWGYGADGQLGTGDRENRLVPTAVVMPDSVGP